MFLAWNFKYVLLLVLQGPLFERGRYWCTIAAHTMLQAAIPKAAQVAFQYNLAKPGLSYLWDHQVSTSSCIFQTLPMEPAPTLC